MKKLMLYLPEEEYEKIRDGGFREKISMSQWVRDRLFGGPQVLDDPSEFIKEVEKFKKNIPELSKKRTSNEVVIKKEVIKTPILQSKLGNCKTCGAGINQYGDYCIGKGHHKQ